MNILGIVWVTALCSIAMPLNVLGTTPYFTETFELGSIFGPVSGYSRSTLAGVTNAPNTTPTLHVNQGGDTEFLYTEASVTHVTAFAPSTYTDATIEGYIGIGSSTNWGGIAGGLILRATGPDDYYVAYINSNPGIPRTWSLILGQSTGGLVEGFTELTFSSLDPVFEDYHLIFHANGSSLTASLFREHVVSGAVVETIVGSLSAMNNRLLAGQAGLYSFARSPNNVFFDDVSIAAVPEPTAAALFPVGLLILVFWGNRRRFSSAQR